MTKFISKSECEAAINASGRGNTNATWVGPAAASADKTASGWYAYCNDFRKIVL